MSKRLMFIIIGLMVIGGLWLAPVNLVTAQEVTEEAHAEEVAAEEVGARGPGAVIIMVGLAAIFMVGFVYISRQENGSVAT